MGVSGTLVVAGDFNNAISLTITRRRLLELNLQGFKAADMATRAGQDRLQQALIDDIIKQPQLFQFSLEGQSVRKDKAGHAYCDAEFLVAMCRGTV
jgi:hypothetical protein